MSRLAGWALIASLLLHGLLAVVLVARNGRGATCVVPAKLEVSHVELSVEPAEPRDPVRPVPPLPVGCVSISPPAFSPGFLQQFSSLRSDCDVAPKCPPDVPDLPSPSVERVAMKLPPTISHEKSQTIETSQPSGLVPLTPEYPMASRRSGEQGDVTLEVVVSAQGRVEDVRVMTSSGFPRLDASALRAVRAAPFVPAKSGGMPIASTVRLTLTFRLR